MQSADYKSFFSPPVPFLLTDASPEAAVRGQAGGVAIFTRTPSRPPLRPVPAPMLQTTRIQTCFTRVGALEIRVICVYGLPSSHPGANDVNDHLMRSALELTQQSQVPTIVAGDWNCEVHTLPTWSAFQQMGYVEAFSAVAARLHITLPPTCKGATFNDTALLAPSLVALLSGAQVLSDQHIFDAHAPLILDFSAPCQLPTTRRWNLPKPWHDFSFDSEVMAGHYDCIAPTVTTAIDAATTPSHLERAFEVWAGCVEQAVDAAIKDAAHVAQDGSAIGLPRSHRGRCHAARVVQRTCVNYPGQAA